MLLHFIGKNFGIDVWVHGEEGLTEAAGEGDLRLLNTVNGSSNGGSVTTDEVVLGLLTGKLGDWWEDTIGITSEEDNVLRMTTHSVLLHTIHEL
jgi:hypothetical protein